MKNSKLLSATVSLHMIIAAVNPPASSAPAVLPGPPIISSLPAAIPSAISIITAPHMLPVQCVLPLAALAVKIAQATASVNRLEPLHTQAVNTHLQTQRNLANNNKLYQTALGKSIALIGKIVTATRTLIQVKEDIINNTKLFNSAVAALAHATQPMERQMIQMEVDRLSSILSQLHTQVSGLETTINNLEPQKDAAKTAENLAKNAYDTAKKDDDNASFNEAILSMQLDTAKENLNELNSQLSLERLFNCP